MILHEMCVGWNPFEPLTTQLEALSCAAHTRVTTGAHAMGPGGAHSRWDPCQVMLKVAFDKFELSPEVCTRWL